MEISSTLQTVNQEELPGGMKIGGKLVTLSFFNAFVICAVISFIAYSEFQAGSQISQTGWFVIGAAILAAAVLGYLLHGINKSIIKPIRNIAASTTDLANEENPGKVPHTNRPDEIGHIARTLMKLQEESQQKLQAERDASDERERAAKASELVNLERAKQERETSAIVAAIGEALRNMSTGDLTCRLEEPFDGELDKLRNDLNKSIDQFSATFNRIINTTESLGTGVREIVSASDDLSTRTEKQAAALEQTANTLGQITETVQKSSEGAENTRIVVEAAKNDAQVSGVVVNKALSAMAEIENSAKEINQIISVIDEIAFQTNLLALNAGVEAARAGEAGQGFAVVAAEVRALAQRSAVAAKEIKSLISKSSEQVAGGSKLVGETGEALQKIADQVVEISSVVDGIAKGAKEQSISLEELNCTVSEMDAGTQQNAAMAEEATAACHSLNSEAAELTDLLNGFKVNRTNIIEPATAPAVEQTNSPAKQLISRVSNAFEGNAAVKEDEWQEF